MRDGFVKTASGTPEVKVADCGYNTRSCLEMIRQAQQQGVKVLCLPELVVTGYTCGDLFLQDTLLREAETALAQILEQTRDMDMLIALGLPVRYLGKLFNCAAVLCRGSLLGLVPKLNLPNYSEFYEARWFASGRELGDGAVITYAGQPGVPFTNNLIFSCQELPTLQIGVEICEDLWVPDTPSTRLAMGGATVILNTSASVETVCKQDYRRELICATSGRLVCGYVYANAGWGESSTDLIYSGHDLIAENGSALAQRCYDNGLIVTELDVNKLSHERQRMTTFPLSAQGITYIPFHLELTETTLTRPVGKNPFVPAGDTLRTQRCEEILHLAALGLKKRLAHTHAKTAVVGLSGGLDSTLALLITARAMAMLGRPMSDIVSITMPCFGTTSRTKSNAELLAERIGTQLQIIDIGDAVKVHFRDIGQSMDDLSVTFENGQARERTQVLMDIANQSGGMVIGTGDLSELALGWATYNGDHMSMYAVNAGIPKTLVRHLVGYVADTQEQTDPKLAGVLRDILDTPVSPELLPPKEGEIAQITEDLVGPYQLHDFFLYYAVRFGFSPRKVFRLAVYALGEDYDRETLLKWLNNFYRRFFTQQFKRSCLPDGPKVGSVTLSPRGDWRMPSDAVNTLWMEELNTLH